jgi:hypothetical protein
MASLTSSLVTVVKRWTEGGTNGRMRTVVLARIAATSMGGTTNTIPASAFGLASIERCTNAVKSDDSVIRVCAPSYDRSKVLVVAAQETSSAPADVTGTFQLEVAGPMTL